MVIQWVICLANFSDRTFTIIEHSGPACSHLHKSSDEIKTGLRFITKEYDNHTKVTKVWKVVPSNKILKELNLAARARIIARTVVYWHAVMEGLF